MGFYPFEVNTPHIVYACLGTFVVFFTLFSLLIREKLYLGEAIWATVFGIAIGPYGVNIVDPRSWAGNDSTQVNEFTMEFTRVVLALGLFAIGVELPRSYILRHWQSLTVLLAVGMTWGWLVCGALIYVLVPGLDFVPSLVVSACLTPTDPILAAAVCGGKYAEKHVPLHIRQILAAESALNDGLAFPFLYLSLYLVLYNSAGEIIKDWVLITLLYEVVLGSVLGCVFGWGFRILMKICEKRDFIDRSSSVAQYVALAVMTMGFALLLGVDELLAAFFAGTAFSWDGAFNEATEDTSFSSVIEMLFDSACFVFIGAWIPFASFRDASLTLSVWRLIVITVLLLIVRRLPPVLMSYKFVPDIKTFKEAFFAGHFGPMGVGAVFISSLAVSKLPTSSENPTEQQALLVQSIQPIVAFVVLWSILIHGLSIPFWTLSKRVNTLSNTWPRSPSLPPEWTQQIRRFGSVAASGAQTPASPRDVEHNVAGILDDVVERLSLPAPAVIAPAPHAHPEEESASPRPRTVTFKPHLPRTASKRDETGHRLHVEHEHEGGHWLSGGMETEEAKVDATKAHAPEDLPPPPAEPVPDTEAPETTDETTADTPAAVPAADQPN